MLRHGIPFGPTKARQDLWPPTRADQGGHVYYGFHSLSYSHIASKLRKRCGPATGGRAILAHLGSGASLCAMDAGRSVATTMGFSTLDGLVMSTRCGASECARQWQRQLQACNRGEARCCGSGRRAEHLRYDVLIDRCCPRGRFHRRWRHHLRTGPRLRARRRSSKRCRICWEHSMPLPSSNP
ncbi:hypothetical protein [Mesorhizobium sp. M0833]|uniref:hypothetical protein n=1 Tax=Mesorhizobium sp. M0833 TaxID=2957009 RepID=UPI00333D2841